MHSCLCWPPICPDHHPLLPAPHLPLPMVYPTWWLESHNMGLGRQAMTQISGEVGLWREAPLSAQSQCQASGPRPFTLSPPASGSLQPSALQLCGLVVTRAPAGSALCWPFPNQWGLQLGRTGGSVPHRKSPCMLQVQQIPVPPGELPGVSPESSQHCVFC